MTKWIIFRSCCFFNKVLNTIEPQHLGAPCATLTSSAAQRRNPEHPSGGERTRPRAGHARGPGQGTHAAQGGAANKTRPNPGELRYCAQDVPIASTEVRLTPLTYNTSVSLVNHHHVCAITDPRKSASLYFSLQCHKLPPPLGIPDRGRGGPGFYLGRKVLCSFLWSWRGSGLPGLMQRLQREEEKGRNP